MLRKSGVNVVQAFNGKEAVNHCRQHKFSLILMDLQVRDPSFSSSQHQASKHVRLRARRPA